MPKAWPVFPVCYQLRFPALRGTWLGPDSLSAFAVQEEATYLFPPSGLRYRQQLLLCNSFFCLTFCCHLKQTGAFFFFKLLLCSLKVFVLLISQLAQTGIATPGMNKGRGSGKGGARHEREGVDMPVGLLPRLSLSGVVLEGGLS